MKKSKIIILGIFVFIAFACKKEEITPNNINQFDYVNNLSENDSDNEYFDVDDLDIPDSHSCDNGGFNIFDPIVLDSSEVITDPNRDDDEIRKVKSK